MPVTGSRLNKSISKFKGYRRRPSRLAVKMTPAVKGGEKFTAGKSVRAVAVKKAKVTPEKTMPESHVNPNRMQGGNTSTATAGEYEKAREYQRKEQLVPISKPKKSFSKTLTKAIFGRRATMRKAKFA